MSQDERNQDNEDRNPNGGTDSNDNRPKESGLDADDPERAGRVPDDEPLDPIAPASTTPGGAKEQPGHSVDAYDEDGNLSAEAENPTGRAMVEPGDTPPTDEGVNPEDPYRVEPYHDEDEPYRYDYYEDGYTQPSKDPVPTETEKPKSLVAGGGNTVPPADDKEVDEDEDDDGMLRMSFMEHLEELRSRLIRVVGGLGVAFVVAIVFAERLWQIVSEPATKALTELGIDPPNLTQITPMEAFNVVYIKLPLIAALFIASPWILYQVWGFIAPGLYKRERKWAAPFVIGSAGLFVTGGLFAYYVAFRFGLTFLLGIGRDINITPMVSITEYFDLFMNVVLAIAVVFELPVLIFFLTLLRIVNPGFLVRNSRYAILGIVVLAAVITPTPDVFNLMIFSVPMIVLFFVGVLLSYILVLHQAGRRFPWKVLWWTLAGLALMVGAVLAVAIFSYGYQWQWYWPFLTN